ncbi:MAG: alpha-L-rhamnosidase N-terminal domain-containing protein [Pirellulaceae bacterium]|nr:alpha-L-rhamnosidase N-terminal domain-containing protein [Pirellulaceae bacterium]
MKTYRLFSLPLAGILVTAAVVVAAENDDRVLPTDPVPGPHAEPPFAQAQWMAPPAGAGQPLPLFRKEFSIEAKPCKATLRIVGLGDYDARVNGKRLADTGINQPWSQYEKTIYYRDFDITPLIQPGVNCVGVMLFNSFWHNPNPPPGRYNKDGPQREASEPLLLCAEVVLEQDDGTIRRIGTGTSWRTTEGPIVFSHIFAGEDFDARRQQPGWDRPGFDDATWKPARAAQAPTATLTLQDWPPFQAQERFSPQSVQEPAPGVTLYSFPQNSSAQLRVELAGGKPGDRVNFRCGEHKNAQDRLFGGYLVGCELVSDGQPLAHQWVSFYLGMQFVEVSGAVAEGRPNPQGLPVIRSLELVHVRTALPEAGTFECSSELLNRTHRLIDWAIRSNTSHVLTDCPHREKLGWLECAYLLAPTFQYRYDCGGWFNKILRDLRDAQEPSGRVLTVAPSYPAGRFPGAFNWTVEWGAAAVLLTWQQYQWSGDPQTLRDNFDMMRRFTDYIQTEAKDGLAPGGLGDWYDYGHGQPPGPSRFTPTQLSATATWALCALTVSRAAGVLGRPEEAQKYRELHARVAADFQRHFRDPATGKLKHLGSPQCANAMALCADVVPPADRAALVNEIVADLEQRGWQQTPGDVGHVYFIRALAEAGRSDVLHRVYAREGLGSYGGILQKSLTALPETWDAMMDGGQSLNHCMLGHVMEWFYGYVAGIRQRPGSVGWKQVFIGPNPGGLTHAAATLNTPAGRIVSRWRIQDGTFRLQVEIPEGVSGSAILPSGASQPLRSGSQELAESWQGRRN